MPERGPIALTYHALSISRNEVRLAVEGLKQKGLTDDEVCLFLDISPQRLQGLLQGKRFRYQRFTIAAIRAALQLLPDFPTIRSKTGRERYKILAEMFVQHKALYAITYINPFAIKLAVADKR